MKHILTLLLLYCCLPISVKSAPVQLRLVPDTDVTVSIYRELDGGYNDDIVQLEAPLKAGKANSLVLGLANGADWEMIRCTFSNGADCELFLFPQDEITVYVSKTGIRFEGSNAAGLQYFYDHFTSVGHRVKYLGTVDKYFLEYVQQQRGIHAIVPEIGKTVIAPQMEKQDSLLQTQSITPQFYEKLHKNTEMLLNGYIAERMVSLLQRSRYREVALKDSAVIVHIADSIYQKYPVTDPDLIKFNYYVLYIPQYLSFYYSDRQPDLQGYKPDIFGPYRNYLHAPQSIQSVLLGGACMIQFKYNIKEMDMSVIKRFFNERFPDSAYTPILNERVKDSASTEAEGGAGRDEAVFLQATPASLEELAQLPECKGKYMLVDLWATWCAPCKTEFKHKDALHELVSSFDKVVIVYVSIDRPEDEVSWKENVEHFRLGGLHLLASDRLVAELRSKIYGGAPLSIPRYLLIAPDGKVMNGDLPRPSQMEELRKELDKVFGK
ncbi:TlpA disulfide reductase family protein [Mediterranea massiliensis]|nr:TlpA disulfide reductase family protein [Mediterranea massiliensis]